MAERSAGGRERRWEDLVHRPTVGVLAIMLLVAGIVSALAAPHTAVYDQLTSACLRVGAVLAVVWLALPDLRQARNRWLIVSLFAACLAVVILPRFIPVGKLLVVLGPTLAAAWLLLKVFRPSRR
jgi:hypothetical protein